MEKDGLRLTIHVQDKRHDKTNEEEMRNKLNTWNKINLSLLNMLISIDFFFFTYIRIAFCSYCVNNTCSMMCRFGNWCGPSLGPRKDTSEHGIILRIYWSNWRWLWCNGYRRRKWFKSWARLIAFHIELIPLGKVWIQLFSLHLWVNSRADYVLQPWWGN